MKDLLNETDRDKHLFKSYYCASCKQRKPCQLLTGWDIEWKSYCCACYYQTEQQKWYRKYWKVDLAEWLENYQCLPVNKNCTDEWLKDRNHLNNCQCLEKEAKESYLLFANSLKRDKERLEKECKCVKSEKIRVSGDYYAWCEKCEVGIPAASKKRVIKNRNDPKFWGLEVKERVLCGDCLEKRKGEMKPLRRAKFNEYRKLRML